MKYVKLILIVFAIGFSTNSGAVTTKGTPSCGEWVKNSAAEATFAADNSKPIPWVFLNEQFWLFGYLTGVAVTSGIDFLKDTDSDGFILWMNNYCNNHPLDDVNDGAKKLVLELKMKMR